MLFWKIILKNCSSTFLGLNVIDYGFFYSEYHHIPPLQEDCSYVRSLISRLRSPPDEMNSTFDSPDVRDDARGIGFCFRMPGFSAVWIYPALPYFLKIKIILSHHFVAEVATSRLHQKYRHVYQWIMCKNPNPFFQHPR